MLAYLTLAAVNQAMTARTIFDLCDENRAKFGVNLGLQAHPTEH